MLPLVPSHLASLSLVQVHRILSLNTTPPPRFVFSLFYAPSLSSTLPHGPPLIFNRSFGLAAFPCDLEVPPCLTYSHIKVAQIASMLASLPLGFILLTHFCVLQALSPLPSSASPFWSLINLLPPPSLSSHSLVRIGCGQVDKRLLRGSARATRCMHGGVGGRSRGGCETRVGDDENERRVRQSLMLCLKEIATMAVRFECSMVDSPISQV